MSQKFPALTIAPPSPPQLLLLGFSTFPPPPCWFAGWTRVGGTSIHPDDNAIVGEAIHPKELFEDVLRPTGRLHWLRQLPAADLSPPSCSIASLIFIIIIVFGILSLSLSSLLQRLPWLLLPGHLTSPLLPCWLQDGWGWDGTSILVLLVGSPPPVLLSLYSYSSQFSSSIH